MTDNTEVKEHAESSELTDMEIVKIFDGKLFCADGLTPHAMKHIAGWLHQIRAVIAADRAQRSESSRDAVIKECANVADNSNESGDECCIREVNRCVDAIPATTP